MNKKMLMVGLALSLLTACNNDNKDHPDAKEAANEQNENKQDDNKQALKEDDAKFMTEAASGGIMEVQLGQYATTNGANPKVIEFGRQMVTDHTKGNDELKALAARKNATLPTAADNDKQKKMDDLMHKKGADFDRAYMDMMVDDHEEDVDLFKKNADHADDADVKSWAAGKVPVLQHHLDMAKSIRDELKKK